MSFLDHLDELRRTLIHTFVGLLVGVIACYFVSSFIQEFLLEAIQKHDGIRLSLLAPTEGFVVRLKISLVAGIFVAIPWILYQIWKFVAPGLFKHERKMVPPVVFFSSLCFLTGAAFAWFVLPWATTFFLGFSTSTVENMWSLSRYIDFILRMFLAFGCIFELPILIYFLARFGIVTTKLLRKYRRHAYVLVLIAASLITPPDVFTQIILALPMVILYEISILLAVIAQKKWEKRRSDGYEEDQSEDSSEKPAEGEG